jgi:hypothetical protein
MKTACLLLSAALACATATTASAYSLSPPDTFVHLRGTVTFTPNNPPHSPFHCPIIMDVKTRNDEVVRIKLPKTDCKNLRFVSGPWGIQFTGPNSGYFYFGIFISDVGLCNEGANTFQLNSPGIWTMPPGQCLSGTLKSDTPLTIVP